MRNSGDGSPPHLLGGGLELQGRKEAGDHKEQQAGLDSSWRMPILVHALLCLFFH
jgi:hypothetical protein